MSITLEEFKRLSEKQLNQQEKLVMLKTRIKNTDDFLALICFVNVDLVEFVVANIYEEDWKDNFHVINFHHGKYFRDIENAIREYKMMQREC